MITNFVKENKEITGIIVCVFSAIIFGLYPVTAKAVYDDGGNFAAVVFIVTLSRFLGLYIGTLYKKERIFQNFHQSKPVIIGGVFQSISVACAFSALLFLPGAIVIVIMFTYSLMHLFFSAYKGMMRLNFINISLTIITLLGLTLSINLYDESFSYPLIGYVLAFCFALATFIRTFIFAQQGQVRSPMVVGAESFFVATLCLLPIFIWQTPVLPENFYGHAMLFVCAISSIIGTYGMFYGLAYLGAYKFSMIMKLEPIFTALFGVLLINDVLAPIQYVGIFIVVAALVLLQKFDRQK